MSAGKGAAGAPGAGLVSLTNKSELVLPVRGKKDETPVEQYLEQLRLEHCARLRKMQRGVIESAKVIERSLLSDGYSQWFEGSGKHREHQYRCAMITLTYAPEVEWEPKHIATLLDHYRKWAKRNDSSFHYVWTLELHKSGKPHYHIVYWLVGHEKPPFPDQQGWWPHGKTRAEWAHSPVGYIAKYASKGTSADLPRGARLWGSGGLSLAARAERSWALAPKWVRQVTEPGSLVRRKAVEIVETGLGKYGRDLLVKTTAWVNALGWALFGPWEKVEFDARRGVVLRHRGYVECVSPCGESFRIKSENHLEA